MTLNDGMSVLGLGSFGIGGRDPVLLKKVVQWTCQNNIWEMKIIVDVTKEICNGVSFCLY